MPFNVLSIADTGAGSPPYADRGAYEFAECDPADGGEPTPGLTSDLRFTGTGGTDLIWSPAPNALFHNLYRGTITGSMGSRLPGGAFDHVCFESGDDQDNGDLVSADSESPPVGTAFYYLSDGEGCSEGPLDSDASHPVPNPDPCPTPP